MINKQLSFKNINIFTAFLVWLTVIIVYYLTKAPTLSFWDCGEFIAASHVLGIPHPPGTPLYILLGRVFSILPISEDPAVRINLLSVIPSSFGALFGYLAASKLLRITLPDKESLTTKILTIAGSASGAFFLAFGFTNWNNSVEAEVYGLAMMIIMAIFWLTFNYFESRGSLKAERIMLLIVFLAIAGIGIHMTTFLIIPAIALVFIINKKADFKIWLTFGGLFIFELYMLFAFSSRPDEVANYVPIIIISVIYIFYLFSLESISKIYYYVGLLFLLNLLPILGSYTKTITGNENLINFLNPIATGGIVLLLLSGFWFVILFIKNRNNIHSLIAGIFALTGSAMIGLLHLFHGSSAYKPFLIISAALLLLTFYIFRSFIKWTYLVAIATVSLVILGVNEFLTGLIVGTVLVLLMGLVFKFPNWKNALLILLVAIIGYSVQFYIPIRSAQQPVINEGNPSYSPQQTIDFMERKQYIRTPMTVRMFERRGEWENQFGDFRRMGYWGFFKKQYGIYGNSFIFLFVLGLFGIWEIIRRRTEYGIPLMILIFLASVGLVLYMNFADGTRQHPVTNVDYLEVRDRDYFFTPAFMLYGLMIGVSIPFIIQFIRESLFQKSKPIRKIVIYSMMVLFLLPIYSFANNYVKVNRSNNYIPYDYATNVLKSADQNAILFTLGDNDTFPLWCIQEAYKERTDVAIVNLTLANARWYIKQVKNNLDVNLGWTDQQIDDLKIFRDQNGKIHRFSEQMVSAIIKNNINKRPINFYVGVSGSRREYNGRSIDSMLSLQGLVYKLNTESIGMRIDLDKTIDLFKDEFNFRGIGDKSVYKSEITNRMIRSYVSSILKTCDTLRKDDRVGEMKDLLMIGLDIIPHSPTMINYLGAYYSEFNMLTELEALIDTTQHGNKPRLTVMLAMSYMRNNQESKAEEIYWETLRKYPYQITVLRDLLYYYYRTNNEEKFNELVLFWREKNPTDDKIDFLLKSLFQE
jgi:hypothetical protein